MFKHTFKYIRAEYAQKRSLCDRNIAQKAQRVNIYTYPSLIRVTRVSVTRVIKKCEFKYFKTNLINHQRNKCVYIVNKCMFTCSRDNNTIKVTHHI